LVAQEEAGELKDAIIYFERNAWLLKKLWCKLSESPRRNALEHYAAHCFVFNAKLSDVIFPDPMREFNAGDAERGAPKALQSNHRTQTKFDRSMVLFDEIVIWHV